MRRFHLILGIGAVILSAAGVTAQPANDYHLWGKVTDTKGNPIPHALIILHDREGLKEIRIETDEQGQYDRWFIPHGMYEVRVEKKGYVTRKGRWNLMAYADQPIEKEINFVLVSEEELHQAELGKKINKAYAEAFRALQAGDCKKAEKKAGEVVSKAPEFFGGYFILGRCALARGQLDEAIAQYRKALSIKNDIPEAHLDLANLYAQKGMNDQAKEEYALVLKMQPDNIDAMYSLGAIYYNEKNWDEAVAHLQRVVEKQATHVQAQRVLGYAYAQKGDYAKAAEHFRKYLELNPNAEDKKAAEEIIRLGKGTGGSGR